MSKFNDEIKEEDPPLIKYSNPTDVVGQARKGRDGKIG